MFVKNKSSIYLLKEPIFKLQIVMLLLVTTTQILICHDTQNVLDPCTSRASATRFVKIYNMLLTSVLLEL